MIYKALSRILLATLLSSAAFYSLAQEPDPRSVIFSQNEKWQHDDLTPQAGVWTVGEITTPTAQALTSAQVNWPANTTLTFAEIDYRTTGEKQYGGAIVSIATGSDGSAVISNLLLRGYSVQMTLSGNTMQIPAQLAFNHNTYGEVWICPVDWEQKRLSFTQPIVGTIADDGSVQLPGWGLFVKNSTEGLSFGAFASSTLKPTNGVMTNSYANKADSTETYPVYIEQTYDNQVSIVNFADNGIPVTAYVNPDKSIEIPPQPIYTHPTYGVFMCNPANWAISGSAQKGSIKGTSSDIEINLDNWGLFSRIYRSLCSYPYRWTRITYSPGTISYPTAKDLVWDGDGSEENPYVLTTSAQVEALAENVNYGNSFEGKHIIMGNDIDLSQLSSAYRPIGRTDESPFCASFDGRGHQITGLRISMGQEPNAAFIGYAGKGSSIKNLIMQGLVLESYGEYAGGIAAQSLGDITHVQVLNSSITHHNSYGGGVVGELRDATVSDATFTGDFVGSGATGGIAGIVRGGTVSHCQVDGALTFTGYYNRLYRALGGLAGYTISTRDNKARVTDSYVAGTIIDNDGHGQIAGLIGNMNHGVLQRCMNTALMSAKVRDDASYNGDYGGLVGLAYGAQISDCFTCNEMVNAQASKQTGQLVGYFLEDENETNTMTRCYASGRLLIDDITKSQGIFGIRYGVANIEQCYYDNQITCNEPDSVTASMALTTQQMTTATTFAGWDPEVWTIADGKYPLLKQFADLPVSHMAAAPLFLNDGESTKKVKNTFTVGTEGGVEWVVYTENGMSKEGTGISIDGGTVTLKNVSASEMIGATADGGKHYKFIHIETVDPSGFVGKGTESEPYLIRDKDDLIALDKAVRRRQAFTGDFFLQTNDIDLEYATDFSGIGSDAQQAHSFDGTYDGGGHAIHRLRMHDVKYDTQGVAQNSGSRKATGFFSYCTENSVVKNLTIAADCEFIAYQLVGPIVAATKGRIENCRNYAAVTAMTDYAAGITAQAAGEKAVVSGCYNSGTILAGGNDVAGIVAISTGTIEYCQNDGSVINRQVNECRAVTAQHTAGGIVASSSASSTNAVVVRGCINTGDVFSLRDVGGIASSLSGSLVENNLNYGMVSYTRGDGSIGAIAGYNITSAGNSAHNYYDAQIAPYRAAANAENNYCTSALTRQLTAGQPLEGFDAERYDWTTGWYPVLKAFSTEPAAIAHRQMVVTMADPESSDNMQTTASLKQGEGLQWKLSEATDFKLDAATLQVNMRAGDTSLRETLTVTLNDYNKVIPLRSIPIIFEGDGTQENPYQIKVRADLDRLSRFTTNEGYAFDGRYFKQLADIDMGSDPFTPIGMSPSSFNAHYDGNSKQISHLNINDESEEYLAFFSNVGKGASVHNLTLDGDIVGYRNVAGIVGILQGEATRLTFLGHVSTPKNPYAGGLVLRATSGAVIKDCINRGTVSPGGGFGGGVVYANAGTVIGCRNEADLEGLRIAGIAGLNSGKVEDCVNTGRLSGNGYLAGIVSTSAGNDTIINCHNEGEIASEGTYVAGVTAYINSNAGQTYMRDCYNTAPISGKEDVGGVIGMARPGFDIARCWNSGDVNAEEESCGGFVGSVYSSSGSNIGAGVMSECFNSGVVIAGGRYVGGFAGNVYNGNRFVDCYNTGDVLGGGYYVGGMVGYLHSTDFERCWNSGHVEGDSYGVGGFAGYGQGHLEQCWNGGNVTSNLATTSTTNGNAGGLMGMGSATIHHCANYGDVTARGNVGGLMGLSNSTSTRITASYNAGRISSTDPSTAAAIVAICRYALTVDSCYWDADMCPDVTDSRATGLTTRQLAQLDLGDGFAVSPGSYPVMAELTNHQPTCFFAAVPVVAEGDSWLTVTQPLTVATPACTQWTGSAGLRVDGGTVQPTAMGEQTLTKTFSLPQMAAAEEGAFNPLAQVEWEKTYELTVTKASSVAASADKATSVLSVTYVNAMGMTGSKPFAGLNIVVTRHADGHVTTVKQVF